MRYSSGTVPYGYISAGGIFSWHPVEGPLTTAIFCWYLRSRSIMKTVRFLNSHGYRTRQGKLWSVSGLAWILHNRVYLGERRYAGHRQWRAHPALVAQIVFNRVGKLLKRQAKRPRIMEM